MGSSSVQVFIRVPSLLFVSFVAAFRMDGMLGAMTDTYQRIIHVLKTKKRVLVTTHVRPDGDALGSAAAMVLGMREVGIEAEVLLLSHLPTKYAWVFQE